MIDSIANLLFRCNHRRLTRPITPVRKAGEPQGGTYVLCLDCGKQFPYDLQEMRVGKALPAAPDAGVLHPPVVPERKSKWRYALLASTVPAAFLIGKAVVKRRKTPRKG
jgi:hypothetical protein